VLQRFTATESPEAGPPTIGPSAVPDTGGERYTPSEAGRAQPYIARWPAQDSAASPARGPAELPLHEPAIQRSVAAEATGPAPARPAHDTSMPLVRPPAFRPPSIPAITTGEMEAGGIVQRVESEGAAAGQEPASESGKEESGPNLDQLAWQIYPIIKHMLGIERERRYGNPL